MKRSRKEYKHSGREKLVLDYVNILCDHKKQ